VSVYMSTFTDWLRERMAHPTNPLRASQIAAYADVSDGTVGNWVYGRTEPDIRSLHKLADGLGIPRSYLRQMVYPEPEDAGAGDLTPDEQDLVAVFRSATSEGRRALLAVAEVLRGLSQDSDESSTGL
jgi:transcriptional regulator with XRE-family HTH domain